MKVSLSWLQTHLHLTDVSLEKMQDQLTFAGIEVEGIEQRGIESDLIIRADHRVRSTSECGSLERLSGG